MSIVRNMAFLVAALVTASASAQSWPQRPVRFIVPFVAGSSPDVTARLIAPRIGSTPAEFAATVQADFDKWGKVIRAAHIKLD